MGLVTRVGEAVNIKDSFTRLQQEYESRLEEENKKRKLDEEARLKQLDQKRQSRKNIRLELITLCQETDARRRGKQLEEVLNRLFASEGILVKESFTIQGENGEGVIQQIDGAVEINSHLYSALQARVVQSFC
jgi:restriction system protein